MKRHIGWGLFYCGVFLVFMAIGFVLAGRPVEAQGGRFPIYTCSADNIAATLTRLTGCISPEPGTVRYVTDIVAQSTTSTAGQFILRTGTGTNCGTNTLSLLPSAATVVRLAAPPNTAAPTVISFRTPLALPKDRDLCVLGVATNTVSIQVNGYLGF
jgi:hypothetical protein